MRFALALALLLIAAPAFAQTTPRIAVFSQDLGAPTQDQQQASLAVLKAGGWPYTLFNANARDWGQSGMADTTWFRLNGYAAYIVLHEDGQQSGTPVASGPYGTNFLDASGTARVASSPLGGRMSGGPSFVLSQDGFTTSATFNDTSTNAYVAGVKQGAAVAKVDAHGTWGYRQVFRINGRVDTLWTDVVRFQCREASWTGAGGVRAIAYADSIGSIGTCADTAVSIWHFQPRADRAGTYYSTLRSGHAGGQNTGILFALQVIAQTTPIRPQRVIETALVEHDSYPSSNTSFGRANYIRLQDVLRTNNMNRTVMTPVHPNEFASSYEPTTLERLRSEMRAGRVRWFPMSYADIAGTQWNWFYFAASDTVGLRQRYWVLYNTATNRDTFNFPVSAYSPTRIVVGGGVVGAYGAKVLVEAGARIIETTLNSPIVDVTAPTDTGWALTAPLIGTATFRPPGASRSIFVVRTYGFQHDTSFTRAKAVAGYTGASDAAYVGGAWINSIGIAVARGWGLYWHTGGSVGVTRQDPYFSWLMDVAARHYGYFDRVIAIDRRFNHNVGPARNP